MERRVSESFDFDSICARTRYQLAPSVGLHHVLVIKNPVAFREMTGELSVSSEASQHRMFRRRASSCRVPATPQVMRTNNQSFVSGCCARAMRSIYGLQHRCSQCLQIKSTPQSGSSVCPNTRDCPPRTVTARRTITRSLHLPRTAPPRITGPRHRPRAPPPPWRRPPPRGHPCRYARASAASPSGPAAPCCAAATAAARSRPPRGTASCPAS